MQKPNKKPLGHHTADSITQAIIEKNWGNVLPGYRRLCTEFGVSQGVMKSALAILTRRGILLPSEGTKPRRINYNKLPDTTLQPLHNKTLVIVSYQHTQVNSTSDAALTTISTLRNSLACEGWQIHHLALKKHERANNMQKISQATEQWSDCRWLLHSQSTHIIQHCTQLGLRTICLGGGPALPHAPCVAHPIKPTLNSALDLAQQAGHQKICQLQFEHYSDYRALMCQHLETEFAQRKLPFSEHYNYPQLPPDDLNAVHHTLTNLLSFTPPTFFIICDPQILVAFLTRCLQLKLSIPDDVSLLVIGNHPNIEWITPTLYRYEEPTMQFYHKLRELIENYPSPPHKAHHIKPILIEGESIKHIPTTLESNSIQKPALLKE